MSGGGFSHHNARPFSELWTPPDQANHVSSLDDHFGRFFPNQGAGEPNGPSVVSTHDLGTALKASNGSDTSMLTCVECGRILESIGRLNHHAEKTGHEPFKCSIDNCGRRYSRNDSLARHMKNGHNDNESNRFSCEHCDKHNGAAAFRRKDHLTQHLRDMHNIGDLPKECACPHIDCDAFVAGCYDETGRVPIARWGDRVRLKNVAYVMTKLELQHHMRKAHKETPFSCFASGCKRRAGKGFFSKKALEKHQRNEHPDEFESLKQTEEEWFMHVAPYFEEYVGTYWDRQEWEKKKVQQEQQRPSSRTVEIVDGADP